MAKKLALEAVIAFSVRGVGASSALLFNYIVARNLQVEEAGYLFLSMSIVFVMVPVGMLGLGRSQVRFISVFHGKGQIGAISRVVGHSQLLVFLGLACVTVLVYMFAGEISLYLFEKPKLEPALRAISPSIFLIGFCYLFAYQFQAVSLTKKSIFAMSIGTPLAAVVILYFWNGADASAGGIAYSWGSALTLVVAALWWVSFHKKSVALHPDRGAGDTYRFRDLLGSCLPLWAVAVFSQWPMWGIHIVAGAYVEAGQIAQLSIAQRIANLISFILIAVNFVIAPKIAQLYFEGRRAELAELARQAAVLLVGWSVPAVIAICVFSTQIMTLFGSDYSNGAVFLVILCLGQLINAITGPANQLLVMSGHEKELRNLVCVAVLVSIGPTILVVQFWGALGAALSIAGTIAVLNMSTAYLVHRRLGVNVFRLRK